MNYVIVEFMHECTTHLEMRQTASVVHEYFARSKLDAVSRSKCAFKSCKSKDFLECTNVECEFYDDREPDFSGMG